MPNPDAATPNRPHRVCSSSNQKGHVTASQFNAELLAARDAGFTLVGSPTLRRNHAALLERTGA